MKKLPMQVVDKNDNIIGIKDRSEIDFNKDIYRVSALWLTNSKGEVLIAQRKLTKDRDPGLWGPAVAGTIEKGETYESNIYKEAEEEIGLTGVKFKTGPKLFVSPKDAPTPRSFFGQWFFGECDLAADKFILQEEEVEAVKWIKPKDLKQDIQQHPEIYTPTMAIVVEQFS